MSGAPPRIVVIGASAGAIQALSVILPELPADFPVPIIIVVHVPTDRSNILAPLFETRCRMTVREAEDKEQALPGVIYFAPPDYHLLVESDATLSLSTDEPVLYSRPSIDVLFESAADSFGDAVSAVILTGASADGARGLKAICEAGGVAMIEEPETAQADTMPLAAAAACPEARILTLEAIADYLMKDIAA
ncbi:two-component system chemotaxis response regulator CheB [Sphingomonas kyeonggiensis]|uniref:chemotaxis protein CheB n=1 Tax=Sphingomonas kyeonggiensis TaxID=1268553 RepID=UPI002783A13F|nr:chemotaxis protein CheB [Sphingomonas kyeonggiensis]MDQ0249637.1 two-component system chemotaxis response regulator CheB [Sphingomonas kyeonggiensis]